MLTVEEYQRYSRQLILDEIGVEGQIKLKQAKVLIVGAGGLGCPSALYLAAAGVGILGLVDFDRVDSTNLQRQILYTTNDIDQQKTNVAKKRLSAVNPHISIQCYQNKLSTNNALEIIKDYDMVVDGTDNFPSRYLVNDACVLLNKANVYGSLSRFEGQVSVFSYKNGPCYRCLFPTSPSPNAVQNCKDAGVIGVLPGLMGLMQANEVIKLLLGIGQSLVGRLMHFDALSSRWSEFSVTKDPACAICGENRTIHQLQEQEGWCESAITTQEISALDLKSCIQQKENIIIIDVRDKQEYAKNHIEGSVCMPLSMIKEKKSNLEKFKKSKIIICCSVGMQSAHAAFLLKKMGHTDIWILQGGVHAWKERASQG